jgi:Xaa-Pro aminopeptidase
MLTKIKNFLKDQNLDYFFLPNSDEFFSEYLPESEKRVQAITGFTGSNATVIFGQKKSYFFTDGRYSLQAKNQLDSNEFEIFNFAEKNPLTLIPKGSRVAFDPKLVNVNFVRSCVKAGLETTLLNHETFSLVELGQNHEKNIFSLPTKLTGADSLTKRAQILQGFEGDAILITKPENICWLLNIRAADVEFTPLLLAYAILFKNGEVDLFVNEQKNLELEKVNCVAPSCFDLRLAVLSKKIKKIQIDESTTNYWLYDLLQKNDFELTHKIDSIELAKSQKNSAEIFGAIKSHEIDGLAVTKFLFWLSKQNQTGKETGEISAAKKLLEFRKESPHFFYESFSAISGFASNGAIIHYHSTVETNKNFSSSICHPALVAGSASLREPSSQLTPQQGGELYLIDSGGQYLGEDFCGTTDITRTISIGIPAEEMRENFTRVLKGHIALTRIKFPRGTSGAQLDILAREHLWNAGLDYQHGTGHGVGSFLSVHEGPCQLSKRGHQELLPGMILSNEPGFYKEGEYGIRIENLMLVEESKEKNFLQFRTLTLAPLDPNLIDFRMMTRPEKKWLHAYHQEILEKFLEKLEKENLIWLKEICKKFEV